MANQINIDITASDRASVVINNLNRNVRGLSDTFKGSFLGNLGANAVTASIGALSSAFGKFSSAAMEAGKLQTQMVTGANSIALSMGMSLDKALTLQESVSNDISKLAADLPGATAEYGQVALQLGGQIGKTFKDNIPVFKETLKDLTRGVGLIAVGGGVDVGEAGRSSKQFLSGQSNFSELRQLDFFQRSPLLVNLLRTEAQRRNLDLDKLKQWTDQQRIEVLNAATKAYANPEYIKKVSATFEAQVESIRSKLFDPTSGIFGFAKRLKSLGDRSIVDTLGNLFARLQDLATAVAKIFGISDPEPLAPIGKMIDFLADLANDATNFLNKMSPGKLKGFSFDGTKVGAFLADITNGIAKGITNFFITADWSKLGGTVSKLALETIKALLSYFLRIDYGQVLKGIFAIFQAICRYWQGGVVSIFDSFFGSLSKGLSYTGTQLRKVWDDFVSFLRGLFTGIQQRISNIVPEPVRQAGGAVSGFNAKVDNAITGSQDFVREKLGINTPKPAPITQPQGLNTPKPAPITQPQGLKPINTPKNEPTNRNIAYNPNINVHAAPGMDAHAVAQAVMDKIEAGFSRYKQEALA